MTRWINFMFRHFGEPDTSAQVGQGRTCACRDASPRVPILLGLTALEWVWVILVADVACVAALVALVTWWAR